LKQLGRFVIVSGKMVVHFNLSDQIPNRKAEVRDRQPPVAAAGQIG